MRNELVRRMRSFVENDRKAEIARLKSELAKLETPTP